MEKTSQADSKGMYSWWWDSHNSPKNSKWLQENLIDMNEKVKQMIKLLEGDADSFARRAEMYYKKRPELMKLVEEFYRTYRALAERYDHATGALRQAHRTMAEAFPNQVLFTLSDDSPSDPSFEADHSRTPEISSSIRAFFDHDEAHKDSSSSPKSFLSNGKNRNGVFNDSFGSGEDRNKVRKGLNFNDMEMETVSLKKVVAKLEAEKEAHLVQYRNLESEISRVQEDSQNLDKRACQAEAEVHALQEAVSKLEAERDTNLLQYQQCLEKISSLENDFFSVQKEAKELNEKVDKVGIEKEAALAQYEISLKTISNLEEDARKYKEEAEKAANEVRTLKQAIEKLSEEKEQLAGQYQQCMEKITSLEHEISRSKEEIQRLNEKIENGVEKLKIAEERCLVLEQELTEKNQELGRLWTCIQEERLHFVEAETAFQTLQHLHFQCQEDLRCLGGEIQIKGESLKDMEARNLGLEEDLKRVREENMSLNEMTISSAISINSLEEEMVGLKEMIGKLEVEIEVRVDERNALQQEIYCLKEELNGLNKQNREMEEEKVKVIEGLTAKNAFLENSISDLSVDLEVVREKVKELEENCRSLSEEKGALNSQLQVAKGSIEKYLEKTMFLENSVEEWRMKSKRLEDSCLLLEKEKSCQIKVREKLISQLRFSLEEELNKVINSEMEIFILQKCMQDMDEKLSKESEMSSKLISETEIENQKSENEKLVLIELIRKLKVEIEKLEQERGALKEENLVVFRETAFQSQLSLLLKDVIYEKIMELKEMRENLEKACFKNNELEEKVKAIEMEALILQNKKSELREANCEKIKELKEMRENLGKVCLKNDELEEKVKAMQMEAVMLQNEKSEIREANSKLEADLVKKDEILRSELEKKKEEVESWESQTEELVTEVVVSGVYGALIEGKMNESMEESNSKDVKIEMMRESISKLGNENGGLRDQLASYIPALISLKDAITSLEDRSFSHHEEAKDTNSEKNTVELDGYFELQDLQKRVRSIETALIEMERLESIEKSDLNMKLEMAMREMEEVKSGKIIEQEHGRRNRHSSRRHRPKSEISEAGSSEVLTKDIILDQMSASSNRMVELWESTHPDASIDLMVAKTRKDLVGPDSLLFEKELGVDKLEISKRFSEQHQEGNKRKVLERLDSDAQKLTNLQIIVEDLKRKVYVTEKMKKGGEYDAVKGELEESEAVITKLFDHNRKLAKNILEDSVSNDGLSSRSLDRSGSVRKRRISEQARKGSEKIGQLQLDIQRLQFLLVKLDDEKESSTRSRATTRISERKPRVLLQDYLYGGEVRMSQKKGRKPTFCGCVQPPSRSDLSS